MYALKIKDKNGNYINEITNWTGFNYFFELNRPGATRIVLNVDVANKFTSENLAAGRSYLDIMRNNSLVWSGIMVNPTGNIGKDTGTVTLNFYGYLWLLNKMFVSAAVKTFTAVDQGEILWTLIDDYQALPNGDFGITEGIVETGILRDRTYQPFKNLYSAFMEMTEVINGCDIEITPARAFNAYLKKGRRLKHVFEYGKNIEDVDFSFDIFDFANCNYALGSGEGEDLLYSVAHNVGSQEIYGMLQSVNIFSDVVLTETLTEHAKNAIAEFGKQTEIYSASVKSGNDPSLFGYSVGDEVRLKIKKGLLDINTYKRIKKISVSVDNIEREKVRVDFQ